MSYLTLFETVRLAVPVLMVVLYGMIATWAFGSQRHWFVRAAIAGASLLALFLVPAHATAATLGFSVGFFVMGLAIWRHLRVRRERARQSVEQPAGLPRISLQDLFLAMVVVAVALTAAVNMPTLGLYEWPLAVADGAVLALCGSMCVWLVFGRSQIAIRAAAIPFVVAFVILLASAWFEHFSPWMLSGLNASRETFLEVVRNVWRTLSVNVLTDFVRRWWLPVAIGMGAFCIWLKLSHLVGWLHWSTPATAMDPSSAGRVPPSRRRSYVSWTFALVTVLIAALPIHIFVQLVTPRPLPAVAMASNENYRELVDVGNAFLAKSGGNFYAWFKMPDAQYRAAIIRDEAELRRLRAVIAKDCQFPWGDPRDFDSTKADYTPRLFIANLMSNRINRGDATGSIQERITASLEAIRLAQAEDRSTDARIRGDFSSLQMEAAIALWNMRSDFSAEQRREVIAALFEFDQQNEPWESSVERERYLLENSELRWHLSSLVLDLVGTRDLRQGKFPRRDKHYALFFRMLLTELGIRSFAAEMGRLPASLNELTPDHLPRLPEDPFIGGPFQYRVVGDGYKLYSVGPNSVDDGGVFVTNAKQDWLADITPEKLYPAPRRPPVASTPPGPPDEKGKEKGADSGSK